MAYALTTPLVLQAWIDATDEPPARIEAAFRGTRGVLTPISGKGGGKSAAVWNVAHLASHAIAVIGSWPVTRAWQQVLAYRDLPYRFSAFTSPERDENGVVVSGATRTTFSRPVRNALIRSDHPDRLKARAVEELLMACFGTPGLLLAPHPTFGHALEDLILGAAGVPEIMQAMRADGWSVDFQLGKPGAVIRLRLPGGEGVEDFYEGASTASRAGVDADTATAERPARASIPRTAALTGPMIAMLAGLLQSSSARTAAPDPARGQNAAALDDQSADAELDGAVRRPHPTARDKKHQSPVFVAGRPASPSIHHDRSDHHGKPGQGAAYRAVA